MSTIEQRSPMSERMLETGRCQTRGPHVGNRAHSRGGKPPENELTLSTMTPPLKPSSPSPSIALQSGLGREKQARAVCLSSRRRSTSASTFWIPVTGPSSPVEAGGRVSHTKRDRRRASDLLATGTLRGEARPPVPDETAQRQSGEWNRGRIRYLGQLARRSRRPTTHRGRVNAREALVGGGAIHVKHRA